MRTATLEDMARIARRYDTALSRAMLKALGLPVPGGPAGTVRAERPRGVYDGLGECFGQRYGVRQ